MAFSNKKITQDDLDEAGLSSGPTGATGATGADSFVDVVVPSNSTATDVAGLKTDFNSLLAALRAAQ